MSIAYLHKTPEKELTIKNFNGTMTSIMRILNTYFIVKNTTFILTLLFPHFLREYFHNLYDRHLNVLFKKISREKKF